MEISRAIEIQKMHLEESAKYLAEPPHKMSEDLRNAYIEDDECLRLCIKALEQMQERQMDITKV